MPGDVLGLRAGCGSVPAFCVQATPASPPYRASPHLRAQSAVVAGCATALEGFCMSPNAHGAPFFMDTQQPPPPPPPPREQPGNPCDTGRQYPAMAQGMRPAQRGRGNGPRVSNAIARVLQQAQRQAQQQQRQQRSNQGTPQDCIFGACSVGLNPKT